MTEKPCEIQCFDRGVDLESKFGGWVRTHGGLIQQVLSLPLFSLETCGWVRMFDVMLTLSLKNLLF